MVYFVSSTELSTAMREMERYGLCVQAFQRQYRMGGQTVVDGYFLTPTDKNQADMPALEGRYWQSYGAMLRDIAQDIIREKQRMTDATAEAVWRSYINDIQQAQENFSTIEGCWATSTCPAVYVMSMLVSGDATALSEVAHSKLVTRVDMHNHVQQNARPTTDVRAPVVPASVPPTTWVPSQGSIYIHPSSYPGERYITNWMRWSDVSGFSSNSTYEHDFFLNDSDTSKYGPGTYLTDDETWGRIPDVSYWSSDLPRPYLDSRLYDPDYQKAYTVGCSDGNAIAAGTWYYTYVRARNGDASIDNGALIPELGHRYPSWCYESTWCVEGDQHEYIYYPWDVDPIPGDFYW